MRDLNALDPLPKLGMKLEAPKLMTEAEKKAKAMRDFETATDKPQFPALVWWGALSTDGDRMIFAPITTKVDCA